ncbi:FAD binding domain containing protein [Apiospora arundinis]
MGATTEVEVGVPEERTETPLTVSLDATKDLDELEPLFSPRSIKVTLDEGGGQLSAPPQTNRRDELSIPREIISSAVSSSIFQSECLRPILAGTYRGVPAYLLRLQFQLVADAGGGNNRGWLSRIKGATIKVLLQDAPAASSSSLGGGDSDLDSSDEDDEEDEPRHPSIVKTVPGPDGWQGQPTTARVEEKAECGLQLGWDAAGVSTTLSRQRTKTETGAVRINAVCKGRDRNSLVVAVAEDAVDAAGIPEYLVLPLIVTPALPPQRKKQQQQQRIGRGQEGGGGARGGGSACASR